MAYERDLLYSFSNCTAATNSKFFNLCTRALFREKGRERERETKTEKVVLKVATVTNQQQPKKLHFHCTIIRETITFYNLF